jgi:hypothetical protein
MHRRSPVGASLLAKASGHSTSSLPDPALSRAGSLLQGCRVFTTSRFTTNPCGSELAREGVQSGNISVERAGLFASRLAPTGVSGIHKIPVHHKSMWERACSRRRPAIQHLHCLTQRYREQAHSYRGVGCSQNPGSPQIHVGASLLAKASGQATSLLKVPASSRSGSLPQGTVLQA